MKSLIVVVVCLSTFLFLTCSNPSSGNGSDVGNAKTGLVGHLVDGRTKNAAVGAAVRLSSVYLNDTTLDSIRTDHDGFYRFDSLKNGTYTVEGKYIDSQDTLYMRLPDVIFISNKDLGYDTLRLPNPVLIGASSSGLSSFIGTSKVKLVFVNVSACNRMLCYIDFSRTSPVVWDFINDRNVYIPTISPDGHYVAYCNNDVGLSRPSKISIRSLDSLNSPIVKLAPDTAYAPRWWVNRMTGDTSLVYTNSACNNGDTLLWPATKTYLQKMSAGRPVGAPQELISNGSYHDGLSADGRYAVTGYTHLIMRNLVTSLVDTLFVSPENGKIANASSQVTDVSISPDTGSNVRCLFFDYGYNMISTVTGCSYGMHQYLFVSTMSDSIVNFIQYPPGEQQWDYPNWSNQPRFAVGCGRSNGVPQSHAVYAIDLDSKSVLQILTGTELQEPYLWVGN